MIVIDNSAGSLAAADPYQNPPEAQLPWLEAVLADARAKGIPTIVMGNRSLNTTFTPRLNVAGDGTEVAKALVAGGASAYVFDRPEENRTMQIPAGGDDDPQLRHRHARLPFAALRRGGQRSGGLALRRHRVIVLELDAGRRDPSTNRAPVTARLIPVIHGNLSLEAVDGTLLRRSVPALFSGLGRRTRGGDRWGAASPGSGTPDPSGSDPYTLSRPTSA